MATHDYVIANGTGAAVRSDLNGALAAIVSQNSSSSAPATMYAYMLWADTTAGIMKMRNGANSAWISLWELDGTFIASDISLAAGSAAAPSLFFTGDTNTGLFSPGADTVALATAGSNRLHITSAGLVGIGTTVPSNQLSIGSNGTATISLDWTSDNAAKASYSANHTTGEVRNFTFTNYFPTFYSNNSERARIDTSGRLLVGTSTARANFFNAIGNSASLQVEGTGGDNSTSSVIRNSNDVSGGAFVLGKTRGTALNSNAIVSNDDVVGQISFQGADGSEFVECAKIAAQVDGTPGANDIPGRLVFSTTADGAASPTERMRIDSSGRLQFNQIGAGYGAITLHTTATNVGSTNTALWINVDSTSYKFAQFEFTGAAVGTITTNGTATAYNTSSDYRLKENVAAVTDGITRLQQLKPSRFNFIADPECTVNGFIAHEAQAVVPECVTGEKDAVDEDGNPVYQVIDQSKLVPLLTAALQEAIAKIETLETKVAALEAV